MTSAPLMLLRLLRDWRRSAGTFVAGEYASYSRAWRDGAAYERARCCEVAIEVGKRVDRELRPREVGHAIAEAIGAERRLRDLVRELDD